MHESWSLIKAREMVCVLVGNAQLLSGGLLQELSGYLGRRRGSCFLPCTANGRRYLATVQLVPNENVDIIRNGKK